MIHHPKIDEFIMDMLRSLDFIQVVESQEDLPVQPKKVVLSRPVTDGLGESHQVDWLEEIREMIASELWLIMLNYIMSYMAKLAVSKTIGDLVVQNRTENPDWGDADWMVTCSELIPRSQEAASEMTWENVSPGTSVEEYKKFKVRDKRGREKFLYWFVDADGWRLLGDFDFAVRGSGKVIELLLNKIAWEEGNAFSIKCLLRPLQAAVSNACLPSS